MRFERAVTGGPNPNGRTGVIQPTPRPRVFSGTDVHTALAALAAGRESNEGPARLVVLAADTDQLADRADASRDWLLRAGRKPEGVWFRAAPLAGDVGFVFAGGSMAYPGMGQGLRSAFPSLLASVEARRGPLDSIGSGGGDGTGDGRQRHVLDQILGAAQFGQVHAHVTGDLLRIAPQAVLGYSSGELSAYAAMVWADAAALFEEARGHELFTRGLTGQHEVMRRAWRRAGIEGGRWASYLVANTVAEVRAALQGEPAVHLMAVNSPDSCVLGGEAKGCQRVLARLRSDGIPVEYDVAVHVPELADVREQIWQLFRRPVQPPPGVRFYTCSSAGSFIPTPESIADAVSGMALGTVDFPQLIERAWADGVRVFVEHGPRGLCSKWIGQILGDREHLAVALDASDGPAVPQLSSAIAELLAAGVPVAADRLYDHLDGAQRRNGSAHLPSPARDLPAPPAEPGPPAQTMAPAPWTQPVLDYLAAPPTPAAACSAAVPAPAIVGAAPVPAAALPPTPVAGPPEPGTTTLAALATQAQRVAACQQDFLTQQAEIQQRFLQLQQNAEGALLTARAAFGNRSPQVPVAAPALPQPGGENPPTQPPAQPRPEFDRAQLESLSRGRVGDVLGPRSAGQAAHPGQIRLPQPPMLLIDRVTGIDAIPASTGVGTLCSQTDVRPDSWYLDPAGRMPASIVAEGGQAVLLLLSWLGFDLLSQGERKCRFLGAELTYYGSPPVPGETLSYQIHVDGHSEHDGTCLVFFRVDGSVDGHRRLSVRAGQAGIFGAELLAGTQGLVWDPEDEIPDEAPVAAPAIGSSRHSFDPAAVHAFADGRPHDCFGAGWEATRAHLRTPRIASGRMLFLHEVTEFAPHGGPWGRGYLRADMPVAPDAWFFASHFPDDPCMPANLMFEGCLQAMSFYLAAMGYTADRDGWRFEPVPESTLRIRCRGEVTPASRRVTYEVLVTEVSAGPQPTVFADVLCTVDGVRAMHARHVGVRLVPDWPLEHWRQLPAAAERVAGEPLPQLAAGPRGPEQPTQVAVVDGFRFDYASLLAWAWGKQSEAFGPAHARFDGTRSMFRMPGPPYHFISRIVSADGPQGGMQPGSRVEAEYDLPPEAWYWRHNGSPVMPLAVLMEIALQPCGWLGAYVGSTLATDTDLLFRNLDGRCTVTAEITPDTRTLRTRAVLTTTANSAGVTIQSFDAECYADGTPVFSLSTVFGYFPKEAFDRQLGLPASAAEHAQLTEPSPYTVDLTTRPARYCEGPLRLAGPMLLMIDRVTGYWPDGGRAGLGRLRSEKDVDPGEWFFKAHFFQDPVQPGSLGIEAMVQLLQYYMIERDMGAGVHRPRFEPVRLGEQLTWKYRGQVVPTSTRITIDLEILAVGTDDRGRYALAEAWLWVDGVRIYHAEQLGMRIIPAELSTEETS